MRGILQCDFPVPGGTLQAECVGAACAEPENANDGMEKKETG